MLLGLVNSPVSFGNYACIIPELAACQAQGIIMREAPILRLACAFQFGTTFLLPFIFYRFGLLIFYSIHFLMSNESTRHVEEPTPNKL
jgi:hypothetical protein